MGASARSRKSTVAPTATPATSVLDPVRLQQMKAAFQVFDQNKDGYISYAELKKTLAKLGEHKTPKQIRMMFRDADINQDKRIDFDEFVQISTASFLDDVVDLTSTPQQ